MVARIARSINAAVSRRVVKRRLREIGDVHEHAFPGAGFHLGGVDREEDGLESGEGREGGGVRGVDSR